MTALMLSAVSVFLMAGPLVAAAEAAPFQVGAAVADFTPPPHGTLPSDPADCAPPMSGFTGPRAFSFMEPYVDQDGSGHYDAGEPFLDCNANSRWDGNFLGGGSNTPRFYTHVADPVTARAVVVAKGAKKIAVEVLDHEGLFNVYIQRIRQKVAADGYTLDDIFISSTHDESAPDSLGLYGVNEVTSSVNDYWNDYLVNKAADAIESAYDAQRPATIRYAVGIEPPNQRQCWSSYPFVDNQRMPVLQALDTGGAPIVTLANVSQHAETLGFNSDPVERVAISADWPHFLRQSLEQQYGGVAIEMAGPVGSVESPQVFSGSISRVPEQFFNASHPAGCRTTFNPNGTTVPLGYNQETRVFGEQIAAAVEQALGGAQESVSNELWGGRRDVCMPLTNALFLAGAAAGIFAKRPAYTDNCTVETPPAPNGSVTGTELKTQVAAFQIGDGEFISLPGEVFPFTYFRSFLGPYDMPFPQYDLPAWPLPHMHTPYRFFNGLAEDMIGYIFPRGNGVGVPGEDPNNPSADSTDRFGCGHSDDSEAASSQAADRLAGPLIELLDSRGQAPERVVVGRYSMPDGSLSRDPLGRPVIKCDRDTTYSAFGPATGVFLRNGGTVQPTQWIALDGRPQAAPDRNTRGYIDPQTGERVWLDVFPDVHAYEVPASASPLQLALVPAFRQCGTGQSPANGSHSPPLSGGACLPPVPTSVGAAFGPAASGSLTVTAVSGDPLTAQDEADFSLALTLSDIRTRGSGADYDPNPGGADATLLARLRITDQANGASGRAPGTATEEDFSAPVDCVASSDTGTGSSCAANTSADALVPGTISEGRDSVLQVFRARVVDSGQNGVRGDSDDTLFAQQGIYVP
jgi:hypothetical protein